MQENKSQFAELLATATERDALAVKLQTALEKLAIVEKIAKDRAERIADLSIRLITATGNRESAEKTAAAFPVQPIILDESGTLRFKVNKLVRFLLERGGLDLNRLIVEAERSGGFEGDWEQFYQLLGSSLEAFCDMDLVSDETRRRIYQIEWEIRRKAAD